MGHKQAAILRQGERGRRAGEQGRRGRKAPSRWADDGRKIASREHAHITSRLGGEGVPETILSGRNPALFDKQVRKGVLNHYADIIEVVRGDGKQEIVYLRHGTSLEDGALTACYVVQPHRVARTGGFEGCKAANRALQRQRMPAENIL